METEAYQKLEPPIDFANCGKVQLTLLSGEGSLASVSMQLVITRGTEALGSEFFGVSPNPEETLEFPVPPCTRSLEVRAIRLMFYRDPSGRDRSTKVAIERFTLLPRSL
jgi:hypothetical protein